MTRPSSLLSFLPLLLLSRAACRSGEPAPLAREQRQAVAASKAVAGIVTRKDQLEGTFGNLVALRGVENGNIAALVETYRGDLRLGGCCLMGDEPAFECRAREHRFGSRDELVAESRAER